MSNNAVFRARNSLGVMTRWDETREALREIAQRFVDLLADVQHPQSEAIGDWSIAQVAAHVREVTVLNSLFALGQAPPEEWRGVFEIARTTTMDGVAALNARSLEVVGEPPLHELAAHIDRQVAELLAGTSGSDAEESVSWLGGTKLPLNAVLGHTVSELFVHGHDIATAERRSDLEHFVGSRTTALKPVTCELRLRGAEPMLLVVENDRVTIERRGEQAVDLRVSADPATMWLVMTGRTAPLPRLVTGHLAVWGRRPWRLRRLGQALQAP
jgi:hypothetical protein